MTDFRRTTIGLALLVSLAAASVRGDTPMRFQELYDLLRTNLLGASDSDLNRAAVQGLIEKLRPRVSLVGEPSPGLSPDPSAAPVSSSVFERSYGYLRLNRLDASTASEFLTACDKLLTTNKLKGLVIDLRFARGDDYGAVVTVADRFFPGEQPLIDWGQGWKNSGRKANAITLPVAVLVNGRTIGGAEALAGILRHGEVALLIGTNTAGAASMAKEFALQTGQRLRVAVAPVKVIGDKELPATGLKPDIAVDVKPEDELTWYENAYKVLPRMARAPVAATNEVNLSGTNRQPRRRLNEADLVRMNREGIPFDAEWTNPPARATDSPLPSVNDPALARALDLLKGLAVVQQFRSI
jgi:carboxyl-terminal processing protease